MVGNLKTAPTKARKITATRKPITDVAAGDPRLARLREQVADLQRRLGAVPDGPSEETVHRLRTGTRRSGALLQSLLAGMRASAGTQQLQREAEKLLRQWKKLRRAAGEVRDLDVHRGLLASLRKTWGNDQKPPAENSAEVEQRDEMGSDATHPLIRQLNHLDAWLKRKRKKSAERLQKQAARRAPRCASLAPAVLAGLERAAPRRKSGRQLPALLALEDFFHISYDMPTLDRKNLHDFRKRTKEARYVAEAGGPESHAEVVARALKRIQDSIGDWHDFDGLLLESQQAFDEDGSELAAQLQRRADQQFNQASLVTERMRRRLLGERLAWKAERRKRSAVR